MGEAEGHYRVFTSPTSEQRYGSYFGGSQASYNGSYGAPPPTVDGDGTVHHGCSGSNISLRFVMPPADASAATTSSAGATFSSIAVVNNGYLELHAQNAAAYAALKPLLGTSGAIASINGSYSLSASGTSYGSVEVTASGGDGTPGYMIDGSLIRSFSLACDYSGYFDTTGSG